ncbi:MAG: lipase [Oscillospiraceae bacterium]|jgi:triacylglycerol lipase|nr:lipase [Oscillospiraceae bacterium]
MLWLKQIFAAITAMVQLLMGFLGLGGGTQNVVKKDVYPVVFVHGLLGWGDDDAVNFIAPHWGLSGGSMAKYLTQNGYEVYAASVGPVSSAWDRACELYAQLTGGRVDYGEAHSKEHSHARYGRTYKALFPGWSTEKKVNLIGHSFGGVTSRLFAQLCSEGSAEERAADQKDLSPLFAGGISDRIFSITTFAAPHNGSTADSIGYLPGGSGILFYGLAALISGHIPLFNWLYDYQLEQFGITPARGVFTDPITKIKLIIDSSTGTDNASYDLSLHGAYLLNQQLQTQPNIYYFSYAGQFTKDDGNGNQVHEDTMFGLFTPSADAMGLRKPAYTTEDGIVIDDSWLANDGLVPTVSALYPLAEAHVDYSAGSIVPGIWNVMPIQRLDHLAFIGDIEGKKDPAEIRAFTLGHMEIIAGLGK